jgi:hypothetical protein
VRKEQAKVKIADTPDFLLFMKVYLFELNEDRNIACQYFDVFILLVVY